MAFETCVFLRYNLYWVACCCNVNIPLFCRFIFRCNLHLTFNSYFATTFSNVSYYPILIFCRGNKKKESEEESM